MIDLKVLFHWFYDHIRNYNLFMPEENDYDDDDQPLEPATILKRQKYSTWLYIIFLIGKKDKSFSCRKGIHME